MSTVPTPPAAQRSVLLSRLFRSSLTTVAVLTVVGLGPPAIAEDTFTVSGVLTTNAGTLTSGGIVATDVDESQSYVEFGPGGAFSLELAAGAYDFELYAQLDETVAYGEETLYLTVTDVDVSADMTLDVTPPEAKLEVHLEGPDGEPRAGAVNLGCQYRQEGGAAIRHLYSWEQGIGNLTLWGFPMPTDAGYGSGCLVEVWPADGSREYAQVSLEENVTTDLTVVIPDPVTVSGTLSTPKGPVEWGSIDVQVPDGRWVQAAQTDANGHYSMRLAPGTYDFDFTGGSEQESYRRFHRGVVITQDTVIDSGVDGVPVTINIVDPNGAPTEAKVNLECTNSSPNQTWFTAYLQSRATGTGQVTVSGVPGDYWSCNLGQDTTVEGPYWPLSEVQIDAVDNELTLVMPSGAVINGGPDESVDSDGVPDLIEALGPNGGDGNHDGTVDHKQAHVASLPQGGAGLGDSAPYLTIVGPAGSKLIDVSTLDPADAPTPPPSGVSLPAGLASWVLADIQPGSDQVVSFRVGDTTGINGYAKYDEDTDTWSLLPAERVEVNAVQVNVTLTDGGVGDADGVADGRITDPGAVAIVQAVRDTTPPVVTGTATRAANANGWYSSPVRIRWTATDPSGVARLPADTVVSGEGSNLIAQSAPVCDLATPANCARGRVEGIKIDRTGPTITATGATGGATYTLGAVPTVGCAAQDALSGVSGTCRTVIAGGNANRVGQFSVTATATDQAGNSTNQRWTYRVIYRFDGFLQPINDPVLTPGTPMSVFARNGTVTAAFALKRADGSLIAPVSAPSWIAPSRGVRTNAAVNEATSTARASSGTRYVLRDASWQYNWSTRGVSPGYQYRLGVRLDDGTTRYVVVGVR